MIEVQLVGQTQKNIYHLDSSSLTRFSRKKAVLVVLRMTQVTTSRHFIKD